MLPIELVLKYIEVALPETYILSVTYGININMQESCLFLGWNYGVP